MSLLSPIPMVDLKAQYKEIEVEVQSALARVLSHTGFILGEEVQSFEKEFARFIGSQGAVGVASGTAALHLALKAVGVGPGDEVLTTAHTFFATAEAIVMCGAKPIFADIDGKTYNLDPNAAEAQLKKAGNKIKAILPVHLYGQPADISAFQVLSKRYGVSLIEDAAQAHAAEFEGRRCGTFGDLACFSFFPGKNLGAYGDAGGVTGNRADLLDRVRSLRDHGRSSKYLHDDFGFGERLDALQAAILKVKLPHLEKWTDARRALAAGYTAALESLDVVTPYEDPRIKHVYHLYVIRVPKRDAVLKHLQDLKIGAGIHYPVPLHRQPAFLKIGYGDVHLPMTEQVASEIISLPIYPEMPRDRIPLVVEALREGMHK